MNYKGLKGCGGRIRTCGLQVMSLTSYLAAPPRDIFHLSTHARKNIAGVSTDDPTVDAPSCVY